MRQEQRPQERAVHAIAERELALAQRGSEPEARLRAQLGGPEQGVPFSREIPHERPGAPTKPDALPMPSISSQRGHDCDGVPCKARSITRAVIFSTTCEK